MNESNAMSSPQEREATLFALALEKPASEHAAFLDGACLGDAALRQRLEALLAAHQKPDTAFADSAAAVPLTRKIEFPEAPDEAVGQTIGRYKLLQRIGEGGCGAVYMAEQEEPVRRRVALKVIKLGMDTKSVIARFEAERQALALMDHPNIAKVLDAGATETGRPFFVMELVKGIKITDYCDRNNLSTQERLDLFIQVCHAIQHAHQKGIIHRDIKPSNILVTLHDGVPVPKVIDFGIAKATEQRLTDKTLFTAYEQFIGTPAYTSPEQAEMSGLDVDTRSDIYALGVLLYELLTGTTPFDPKELMAAGLDEMRRTIREKEPARPSTRLSTMLAGELTATAQHRQAEPPRLIHLVRGDLDWIVMKCLEKDRTRRYETANSLAADLKRHLNNEPVVARPPSAAYRFHKLVRRNKLAVAASAAVLMVLIFGVVISTWQALRATRAELKQSELAEQATRAQDREAKQRSISEQRLYDLLFGVAKSKSHERRAGYRDEVFQHLRQATTLNVPQKDPLALRDVAMSCLGDVAGLSPVLITNFPADTQIEAFKSDPSGQIGAFRLSDGSIQLRKLPSGEELERLNLNGEQPAPRFVRFAFSEDGQQLASLYGMPDRSQTTVCLWARGSNGRWGKLKNISAPNAGNIGVLNGGFFVTSYDESAQINRAVDLETGKVIAQLEHSSPSVGLGYTTSGFLIMVTREPGLTVHVWNVREGRKLPEIRPKLQGSQCEVYDSKDGRLLICVGRSGAEIYSLPQLERVAEFDLPPRMLNRRPASFARNNALVGIASDHRRIGVWDWASQREVFTFDDVDTEVGLRFTADDKYLVAVGNRQVRLCPLSAQTERTVVSNRKPAKHMVGFSPDSRRFGSVCGDGQLVVGDVWTGQSLWETNATEGQAGGKPDVSFVSFRHDGLMAVSSYFELPPKLAQAEVAAKTNAVVASVSKGELAFWSEQRRLRLVNASTQVMAFVFDPQFTPDGRFLLTMGEDRAGNGRYYVWRMNRTLSEPAADSLELENVMTTDAFSRPEAVPEAVHNQHFAYVKWATNGAPEIHLVELEGQRIDRILRRGALNRGGLQRLAFTPDGRQLLVVNTNYEIVALDIVTGEAVTPPIKPRMVSGADNRKGVNISLSPDGSKLAVFIFMSPGAGVEIWDWKARQYLYSLPEPSSSVFCAQWSPDSQHFAVSSYLETSIWHLALVERALADLGLFAEAPPLSSPGGNPDK